MCETDNFHFFFYTHLSRSSQHPHPFSFHPVQTSTWAPAVLAVSWSFTRTAPQSLSCFCVASFASTFGGQRPLKISPLLLPLLNFPHTHHLRAEHPRYTLPNNALDLSFFFAVVFSVSLSLQFSPTLLPRCIFCDGTLSRGRICLSLCLPVSPYLSPSPFSPGSFMNCLFVSADHCCHCCCTVSVVRAYDFVDSHIHSLTLCSLSLSE